MPRYVFICDDCSQAEGESISVEFFNSIKEGPPSPPPLCPKCNQPMRQDYECNFILKGYGWYCKDSKRSELESDKAREETTAAAQEHGRAQTLANEVAAIRRKGKKATEQFKKDHPEKWAAYSKNLATKGVKGIKSK